MKWNSKNIIDFLKIYKRYHVPWNIKGRSA